MLLTIRIFMLSNMGAFYVSFLPDYPDWASSTELSQSGYRGHHCLNPELKEKAFSFHC